VLKKEGPDMEVWQIILYGMAAFLALKSLTSLMTIHRDRLLREITEKAEDERREEHARAKAEKAAARNKSRRPNAA
jgi:hypothetical protein